MLFGLESSFFTTFLLLNLDDETVEFLFLDDFVWCGETLSDNDEEDEL